MSNDNWSVNTEYIDYIKSFISTKNYTMLELGSGLTTHELKPLLNLISIEENLTYFDRNNHPNMFHVEIKNEWYNFDKVQNLIKKHKPNGILIDGPAAGLRSKFIEFYQMYLPKIDDFFIDDINRLDDYLVVDFLVNNSYKSIFQTTDFIHLQKQNGVI